MGSPLRPETDSDVMTPEVFPPPSQPTAVADRLLDGWRRGGTLTLRHWRGAWMAWTGPRWAERPERHVRAEVYRRLKNTVYQVVDKEGRTDTLPWAPTRRKVADVLEALAAETHLPDEVHAPCWLDAAAQDRGPEQHLRAPAMVACTNGLLDVASRELHELTPEFFNLVSVPFPFDPDAPAPDGWHRFLSELWPDDPDAAAALQEFFGYVLSGRTDLHKLLLIVGPTRSGKGTIARLLGALVGTANVSGPTLASLCTNFGLSPLLGKPLAVVSDARLAGRDSSTVVERLLSITGEDTITVDRKYAQPWTGKLPTRFLILSNELPSFGDASGAIVNRFVVLPMSTSFLGRENTALTDELSTELPGILNWTLAGLDALAARGRFTEPASSVEAVVSMKDAASPTSAFVRDRCTLGAGYETEFDALYRAWKLWCFDNGRDHVGTKQSFAKNLRAAVPTVRPSRPRDERGERVRCYVGIQLGTDQDTGSQTHNAPERGPTRTSQPNGAVVRDGPRPNPLCSQHEQQDDERPCDRCSTPGTRVDGGSGARLCQECGPHLWRAVS